MSGLNAGDKVIQDPPDSLIEGEKVYVESPKQPARMREASKHGVATGCKFGRGNDDGAMRQLRLRLLAARGLLTRLQAGGSELHAPQLHGPAGL